jgi:hypothetical protein
MSTFVRSAGAKGRGVFARKSFRVGSIIEDCHLILLPKNEEPALLKTTIGRYIFAWERGFVLALGHGSLYNHSYKPNAAYENLLDPKRMRFRAIKPIKKGQEITVNYNGEPDDQDKGWFDQKKEKQWNRSTKQTV